MRLCECDPTLRIIWKRFQALIAVCRRIESIDFATIILWLKMNCLIIFTVVPVHTVAIHRFECYGWRHRRLPTVSEQYAFDCVDTCSSANKEAMPWRPCLWIQMKYCLSSRMTTQRWHHTASATNEGRLQRMRGAPFPPSTTMFNVPLNMKYECYQNLSRKSIAFR